MRDLLRDKKSFSFILTMCLVLILGLNGCGSNIFETLETTEEFSYDTPQEAVESLTQRIDVAETPEEFEEIQVQVQEVIEDPETSSADLLEAQVILGQSVLAKNDLSLLSLAEGVFEVDDSDGPYSGNVIGFLPDVSTQLHTTTDDDDDDDNLIEILGDILEDATTADLYLAADALNEAQNIASLNVGLLLEESEQLTRAVSNAFVISKELTIYFDISTTGVTFNTGWDESNVVTIIDNLFNLNLEGDSRTIVEFGYEMHDAFIKADLPDDIDNELIRIKNLMDDFQLIRNAMLFTNGVYTLNSTQYNVGSGFLPSSDRNQALINAISDSVEARFGE